MKAKHYEIVLKTLMFINPSYERTANGKGEFKQRGSKKDITN